MKRYFAKIDEKSENIYWELNKKTNDVLAEFSISIYCTSLCITIRGNLFVVLEKYKDRMFKVLFLSESADGMLDYFDINEFTPADALYWAYHIGDKDVMIDKITTSYYAYCWARDIGNHDVMIDRITDSEDAYFWAREIGNKDIMREKITNKSWMKLFKQL